MTKRILAATLLGAGLIAGCEPENGSTTPGRTTSPGGTTGRQTTPSTPPSTTPGGSTTTPKSPSGQNNQRDTELVATIRRTINDDTTLSASAKNVKVVVEQGTVTLSGTVESQDEKQKIEQLVTNMPGVTSVENNIEVRNPG